MRVTRLNPVGAGVVVIGGLLAIISLFLPIYQPTGVFSSIQDNSLVQGPGLREIAGFTVLSAIAAAGLLWRYQQRRKTGWGVMVWGLLLVGEIGYSMSRKENFTLTSVADPSSDLSIQAHAGIAWYLALVAGALIAVGGFMVWRQSDPSAEEIAHRGRGGEYEGPAARKARLESEGVSVPPAVTPSGERVKKRCPACAEDVWAEATVCRYCGHEFELAPAPPR